MCQLSVIQELQHDVQLCGVTKGERTETLVQPVSVSVIFLDKDCSAILYFILFNIYMTVYLIFKIPFENNHPQTGVSALLDIYI